MLLDEIEKAHPDTFNILLQVLDEGRLTDNKGRVADFKNTIIIMTSNIGSEIIQSKVEDFGHDTSAMEAAKTEVIGVLKKMVRPEFLNRIDDTILFSPLHEEHIKSIVKLQLKNLSKTLQEQGVVFDASPEAIAYLAKKGYQPEYGARPVKRVIQKEVLNTLSKKLLTGSINSNSVILMDAFDHELIFRNQNEKIPKEL